MKLPRNLLWIIPGSVYSVSYLYLAVYHQDAFLFDNLVHEGGTHTLLESIFYFSHFLGHVPVVTVLALLFTGTFLSLSAHGAAPSPQPPPSRGGGDQFPPPLGGRVRVGGKHLKHKSALLLASIAALLVVSFVLSLSVFGADETLAFILQQKQGVDIYQTGGSWNLHLPSTVSLFFFIPVFIFTTNLLFGSGNAPNPSGRGYLISGFALFLLVTILANLKEPTAPFTLWADPRYLAHGVRELMTFPLTYFPIPLYFFYRDRTPGEKAGRKLILAIAVLALLFLAIFLYQCILPLSAGIGELAQKPAFAEGGRLSIAYLLFSHYFEHVLDSVYFALLCLLLYRYDK